MSCTPGRVVSKVRELNLPQETSMRSLILPRLREGIPESTIFLLVESGIREILSCGIRNSGR